MTSIHFLRYFIRESGSCFCLTADEGRATSKHIISPKQRTTDRQTHSLTFTPAALLEWPNIQMCVKCGGKTHNESGASKKINLLLKEMFNEKRNPPTLTNKYINKYINSLWFIHQQHNHLPLLEIVHFHFIVRYSSLDRATVFCISSDQNHFVMVKSGILLKVKGVIIKRGATFWNHN